MYFLVFLEGVVGCAYFHSHRPVISVHERDILIIHVSDCVHLAILYTMGHSVRKAFCSNMVCS